MAVPDVPKFDANEEQALATFNHAAEEIRFFKGQEWNVTNYTLLAYAALAAAPDWVGPVSWRSWISGGAIVLILLAAAWAWLVLVSLERALNKERRRLHDARDHLLLMEIIHRLHPPEDGPDMPPDWATIPRRDKLRRPGIFVAAVLLGALVASLVNLSRIPCPHAG